MKRSFIIIIIIIIIISVVWWVEDGGWWALPTAVSLFPSSRRLLFRIRARQLSVNEIDIFRSNRKQLLSPRVIMYKNASKK